MKKRLFFYGFMLIGLIWCVLIEPRWMAARSQSAQLPRSEKLGLKVVLTSDWHLTQKPWWRVMSYSRAEAIIEDINASQPDIVLIAGDLIAEEKQTPTLGKTVEEDIALTLGKLKAKHGIYAVLGNHDNWYNHQAMKSALTQHGIKVLENEATAIANTPLWLTGVGDESTHHADVTTPLKAMPPNVPALVMMHDPGTFAHMPANMNALFFAGHTHGGQVYLPFIGALVVPYAAPKAWAYGWVEHQQNKMYVTSGLGVSILPVRFNMRPEWVLFEI